MSSKAVTLVWLWWSLSGCSPAQPAAAAAPKGPRPAAASSCSIDAYVSGTYDEVGDGILDTISTGAEPRRVLRYALCQGCTETASVALAMELSRRYLSPPHFPDKRATTGRYRATLRAALVASGAGGGTRYTYSFVDAEAVEAPTEPPPFDAAAATRIAQEHVAGINSARAEVEIDARGRVRSLRLDSVEPLLLELEDELLQATVPLPHAAVGVGARWRAVGPRVKVEGIWRRNYGTYELTGMTGDVLEVTAVVREMSEPDVSASATPAECQVQPGVAGAHQVLWFSGTRQSKLKLRLDRLLPEKHGETQRTYEETSSIQCKPVRDDLSVTSHLEMIPQGERSP